MLTAVETLLPYPRQDLWSGGMFDRLGRGKYDGFMHWPPRSYFKNSASGISLLE